MQREMPESPKGFSPNAEEGLQRTLGMYRLLSDASRFKAFLLIAKAAEAHQEDIAMELQTNKEDVIRKMRSLLMMGIVKENGGYYSLTESGASFARNIVKVASDIDPQEHIGDTIEQSLKENQSR